MSTKIGPFCQGPARVDMARPVLPGHGTARPGGTLVLGGVRHLGRGNCRGGGGSSSW